jgi:DNA-binding GntR family transcriptional regulator
MPEAEGDQDPIDRYETAYEVVARRLRRRIEGGEFVWHSPIPSEPDLAEWYGVSRTTVRSAVELLMADGMGERRRGKGTFVVWRRPPASHDASRECAE